MSKYAVSGLNLTRVHKLTAAGIAAAGAAALVFTAVPGADAGQSKAEAASASLNVKPVAFSAVDTAARAQQATIAQQADASAAQGKAEAAAAKKRAEAEAKAKAEKERQVEVAASRAAVRQAIPAAVEKPAKIYPNNLDGWIRESLAVMAKHNIPGSYNGIYRNLMRESSGNPKAINLWDSNAQAGIPSKGLLQVIDPTFRQYHVSGTSWNIYDPVANITAACNYAAARYGSMDNVNSAY
ncbi:MULTISPECIES: transglycosylase SLT domain-containing protein [Streptomyces]|uniref:Lytic transglycosylase n=2 Tax=Streptomyces TaxID=1883 RepID=A0A2N8PL35_STRNR|nr:MULTISPECIES: transglycosylase SLT domain-containing protein [Streptomyces]PNE41691.1 lytic transglycosylase [Streptomyces noursei]SHL89617.1 Transglycosylase SLT domain-containing protein [Streptomyces yunnanensis]